MVFPDMKERSNDDSRPKHGCRLLDNLPCLTIFSPGFTLTAHLGQLGNGDGTKEGVSAATAFMSN
jgi:hypothetical protein